MKEQEALLNYVCQSSPEVNIILRTNNGNLEGKTFDGLFTIGDVPIEETFTIKENESSSVSHSLINEDDKIFEHVKKSPSFPGGYKAQEEWIRQNLRYPQSAKEKNIQSAIVWVEFVVNKDGSIVEPKVLRSVDPDLDKEAIRLISSMPKWVPGKNNGKEVRVHGVIPIPLRLN